MIRFVVIATANRGVVDPPEALDDAGQYVAMCCAEIDDAADREILRGRATRGYQTERDAVLTPVEARRLASRERIA